MIRNLAVFLLKADMKSKQSPQFNLFKIPLDQLCDSQNSLYRLADTINWQAFEERFGQFYCEDNGRPAKPIRLMVGLHYLKATFVESNHVSNRCQAVSQNA